MSPLDKLQQPKKLHRPPCKVKVRTMRFLRKYAFWVFLFCLISALVSAPSPDTARTRLADGFDQPVGKPDAVGYYTSRGFRQKYHMGEDWNGLEGGNRDLGKPVYAAANGIVVLARDMRMGWGNLIIIRHIFLEDQQMKTADSVYAHLDKHPRARGKANRPRTAGRHHWQQSRNVYGAPSLRDPEKSLSLAITSALSGRTIPTTTSPVHLSPSGANFTERAAARSWQSTHSTSRQKKRRRWLNRRHAPKPRERKACHRPPPQIRRKNGIHSA